MAEKQLYNMQTNEEIIEELTKDLKSSCMDEDGAKSDKKENSESMSNKDDPWENIGKDPDEEKKNGEVDTAQDVIDEDFSDEEELKDRDLNLTEDEKEVSFHESLHVLFFIVISILFLLQFKKYFLIFMFIIIVLIIS